jgi:hypothetical protein
MTEHDDGAAVYTTVVARRNRRRKQVVAGVVGLAALLGGGAFFVTEQLTGDNGKVATDTGALAPLAPAMSAGTAAAGSRSAPATPSSKSPASHAPSAAATPRPKTTAERIAAARGKAAKAAGQVRPPLPPNGNVTVADGVTESNSGSLKKDGATLRLVSARSDLTGLRELAWAADDGVPVGDARCTQNFHFSGGAPAVEKPTMMLCWRTSATKSVFTVAVVLKGRPSAETSVAAIDKQWAKLG